MKYYTGIGSRSTPKHIQEIMAKLATALELEGYILRSGGAEGADKAFEEGVKDNANKDIYLPWKGFNGSTSNLYTVGYTAKLLASHHHPAWKALKEPVQKLMGRNAYQVLGSSLDTPSKFVVCWTPDKASCAKERTAKTGGTGLAISLADHCNVEVINLAKDEELARILKFIKE